MTDVTRILNQIEQGDRSASDRLLPLVYEELRGLARRRLANENPGQTLQATALVHEAYIRLVGNEKDQSWDNRGHFFAAAAEAMRRILVDRARQKASVKRGGDLVRLDFDLLKSAIESPADELLALDDAIRSLANESPRKAELVKLRFYAGCTINESAVILGISPTTAKRYWTTARAWLFSEIRDAQK
jgi:RNA polymerase sigma factor (TIGR02999 family)